MSMQLMLGEDQLAIDRELKLSAIRGNQGDRFNFWLKLAQQLSYQTGSPVCIVSNRTVDQFDLHQHFRTSKIFSMNTPANAATGVI
jgi:hypothetical protein